MCLKISILTLIFTVDTNHKTFVGIFSIDHMFLFEFFFKKQNFLIFFVFFKACVLNLEKKILYKSA